MTLLITVFAIISTIETGKNDANDDESGVLC